MKEEGKFLRDIRYNLDLTQREFAEKLGSCQQTIAMIEKGEREVPKSIIKALSESFNIDFYGSINDRKPNTLSKIEFFNNVDTTYILSLTAKVQDTDVINKVTELLKDIQEISIIKVG